MSNYEEVPDPTADVPAPVNPPPIVTALRTVYDYWNASYRGFTPHGVRVVPQRSPLDDEPVTFEEDPTDASPADYVPKPDYFSMVPIPVAVIANLTTVHRETETYFNGYVHMVSSASIERIVNRELTRINVIIRNNGPGRVFIGSNESVARTGYPLSLNETIELKTTRDIWAVQASGEAGPAEIAVIVEYDKPIPDSISEGS